MCAKYARRRYNRVNTIMWDGWSRRGALVVIAALRRRLPGSVGWLVVGEGRGGEQWVPAVRALWQGELVKTDLCATERQVVLEAAAALPQHHHQRAAQGLARLNMYSVCVPNIKYNVYFYESEITVNLIILSEIYLWHFSEGSRLTCPLLEAKQQGSLWFRTFCKL